jgi:NAD(P)-dependent dehydrogenase (short-subunit alcohol dehydrogenase family)
MRLEDLVQGEMEEVYRINAVSPCLLLQALLPLLRECQGNDGPYVINVLNHAQRSKI